MSNVATGSNTVNCNNHNSNTTNSNNNNNNNQPLQTTNITKHSFSIDTHHHNAHLQQRYSNLNKSKD
jgi:hypothetical protein